MADRKEYKEFQELLRKGIGNRSQKEFAEACRISREHLGRLLKERFLSRPEKRTLIKLSKNLEGVSLAELYIACGYKDEAAILTKEDDELTEAQKRKKLPPWERCMACMDDLKQGFASIQAEKLPLGKKLSDAFDYVSMLYTAENVSFSIRKADVSGDSGKAAVEAVCDVGPYRMQAIFVLFFHYAGDENLILDRVSFSGRDVMEMDVMEKHELKHFSEYGIRLEEEHYVLLMDACVEGSAEARLLRAIFGDTKEPVDSVITGFGFFIPKEPPKFWSFLMSHKDSFCRSSEEKSIYAAAISKDQNAEEAFHGYYGDAYNMNSGYRGAIVAIMSRESEIPFSVFEDTLGEYKDNPPCIICEDENNVDQKKLEAVVYQYAKELGIPYIERCYFKTKLYKEPNRIKVD